MARVRLPTVRAGAALERVVSACLRRGRLVLVVKGMIRQRGYVDVPEQTAALLEEVGFVVQHWHQAMLTSREAQLTLDGREERQRHLSFFRRVHARRGAHVFVDHEVVLCAEKPRA